jgi:hypothetical protein
MEVMAYPMIWNSDSPAVAVTPTSNGKAVRVQRGQEYYGDPRATKGSGESGAVATSGSVSFTFRSASLEVSAASTASR